MWEDQGDSASLQAPSSHAHTCVVFEDLVGAEVVFRAVYNLIRRSRQFCMQSQGAKKRSSQDQQVLGKDQIKDIAAAHVAGVAV